MFSETPSWLLRGLPTDWETDKKTGMMKRTRGAEDAKGGLHPAWGIRENLQEAEVFQLNAGEKAGRKRGKERKGCLWWWAQRVEKLASEVCRRNSRHPERPDLEEDARKGEEAGRPITAQEGRCGRSFRSAPSHWPPAFLRRARPGPISGGHGGLVRGREAYLPGHPGPERKAAYLGGSVLWRGLKRT